MEIAHVLRCMAPRMTGHVHSVTGFGTVMAAWGHRVTYWSAAHADDRRRIGSPNPSMRVFDMRRPHGWFYSPALALALKYEIGDIDLVHVHGLWSHPNWAAVRIAARADVPCLLSPHGELSPWALRRTWAKRLKKAMFLASLGRSIFRGIHCLHALSRTEAGAFRQAGYRGPVTIVPNGVDAGQFAQLPDADCAEERFPELSGRRVVLFIGRISPEKGLDALLSALARLVQRPSFDDVLLVLAGIDDGGHMTHIRDLIERLRLSEHVLLPGRVHIKAKRHLLARCDLFVLPSHSEGFSMAVLEALASARPVLVTPACGFPDIVHAQAGLCRPAQPEALAEGLMHLLDLSPDHRDKLGRRGRRLVLDRYTWPRQAARMLNVYRAMLEGGEIPEEPQPDEVLAEDSSSNLEPSAVDWAQCLES